MNNYLKRGIAVILPAVMLMSGAVRAEVNGKTVTAAYTELTEKYMKQTLNYGDEWIAIGLSRGGNAVGDEYYQSVKAAIKNHDIYYQNKPSVSNNARVILALTAMGKSADAELFEPLSSYKEIENQYYTAAAYALASLDSNAYEIPQNADAEDQNTREKMTALLASCLADDSTYEWGADGAIMIIQALAPYYDKPEIKTAVDAALDKINGIIETSLQDEYSDAASTYAQCVIAYAALQKDPSEWVNKLMEYYSEEDTAFLYNGSASEISTYQGYDALAAYIRYSNNENALFNMTDAFYNITSGEEGEYIIYSPFNAPAVVIGADYADGVASGVEIEKTELRKGNTTIKSGKSRLMLWNTIEGLTPLCESGNR